MGQSECRTDHEIIWAGLPKLHYEAGLTFTCKSVGFLKEEKVQPRSETFIFTDPPRPLRMLAKIPSIFTARFILSPDSYYSTMR